MDHIVIMEEEDEDGLYFPSEAYIVKNTADLDAVQDKLEPKDIDIDDAVLVLSIANATDLTAASYVGEDFPVTVIE